MENKHGQLIENTINDFGCQPTMVGKYLANTMHRYLQNTFFKIVRYFIGFMAKNYEKGWYDARNEDACRHAKTIYDNFDDGFKAIFEYEYEKLNK